MTLNGLDDTFGGMAVAEGAFAGCLAKAAELLDELVLNDEFATFLTLQAYEVIA